MEPPLRERLDWRTAGRNALSPDVTRGAMATSAAAFAAAAALFGFVAVAVPETHVHDEGLLAVASGGAALLALALLLVYDRIPPWGFHVAAGAGTALASLAAYALGTKSAYAPLPYLWVALLVFYFFALGPALVHTGLMATGYGLALALESPADSAAPGWLATVGTLVLVGLFVGLVREQVVSLIAGLSEAARRDPLTDLLNRRGFQEAFDVELERARRTDAPLSVVVGDIDRFKRLNDVHGHAAGDAALKRIGEVVRSEKRSFDTAARVGGEEFAMLVPDTDEHGAYMLAERVRTHLEHAFEAQRPGLTISLGVATYPLHGQSAESLLRAADQALYAAKRLGRNRSVISSAEVPGILARPARGHEESQVELASLLTLAEALDVRESGNAAHCQRVGRFAELVARELGLPPDSVERVRLAGILHDVGRVGVPDELMRKRGPLTTEEWERVRAHPEIGARMLEMTAFDDIRSWVLLHHERPDGAGYPEGRPAGELPLEARILAVADAYEAMTSERAYRPALTPEQAAAELRRGAGSQFDADVVDSLLRVV